MRSRGEGARPSPQPPWQASSGVNSSRIPSGNQAFHGAPGPGPGTHPRARRFLLCVVIGLPGLQDPLDQAALLEELGGQADWSGSEGCVPPSTLQEPMGSAGKQAGGLGKHRAKRSRVSKEGERCVSLGSQRPKVRDVVSCPVSVISSRGKRRAAYPGHVRVRNGNAGRRASGGVAGLSTQRLAGLTWVTIVLSGWLAAGSWLSESPLSGPVASALSSRGAWERIAATHSSTWRCRKLFQVYLKNRSWGQAGRGGA